MRLEKPLDLITQMVQGLYSAETLLTLALPRVASRAHSNELRSLLDRHFNQTKEHAVRLEHVAGILRIPCNGKPCIAMQGLLKEGEEHLGYGGNEALIDTSIIASCQAIEHYEIVAYSSLLHLLRRGEHREAAQAIEATLREEQEASDKLADHLEALGMPQASE